MRLSGVLLCVLCALLLQCTFTQPPYRDGHRGDHEGNRLDRESSSSAYSRDHSRFSGETSSRDYHENSRGGGSSRYGPRYHESSYGGGSEHGSGPSSSPRKGVVSWFYRPYEDSNYMPSDVDTISKNKELFGSLILDCGHRVSPHGGLAIENDPRFPRKYNCDGANGILFALQKEGISTELWIRQRDTGDEPLIKNFHALFENPFPFINQILAHTSALGVRGWHFDVRPTQDAHSSDSGRFASFLSLLRSRLPRGVRVTAAVDSDSPLLSEIALIARSVDKIVWYAPRTSSSKKWKNSYDALLGPKNSISLDKIAVGIMCLPKNLQVDWGGKPESAVFRTQQLITDRIDEVFMNYYRPRLQAPQSWWWPYLRQFISRGPVPYGPNKPASVAPVPQVLIRDQKGKGLFEIPLPGAKPGVQYVLPSILLPNETLTPVNVVIKNPVVSCGKNCIQCDSRQILPNACCC